LVAALNILGIDPGLRNTGLVLLDPRSRVIDHWTIPCGGEYQDLAALITHWFDWNAPAPPFVAAIEMAPPRVRGRKYQREPVVVAGMWLHALGEKGIYSDLIDAWTWQRVMLGPKKDWPQGKSKLMAALRCRGEGVRLPNEHTRDAYLIARYTLKQNRLSALIKRAEKARNRPMPGELM